MKCQSGIRRDNSVGNVLAVKAWRHEFCEFRAPASHRKQAWQHVCNPGPDEGGDKQTSTLAGQGV